MDVTIATLTPRDASLFEPAHALFARTLGANVFARDHVRDCVASPDCRVVVARDAEDLVGVAVARVLAPEAASHYAPFGEDALRLFRQHRVGSLESMSVHERAQGRGIGQRLARVRLAWLAERGCDVVVGISWMSGLAHTSDRVFDKLGFRALATVPGFYVEMSRRVGLVCAVCGPPPCRCPARLYWRTLAPTAEF